MEERRERVPSEGTETKTEDVTHDILDVRGISEVADTVVLLTGLGEDIGVGSGGLRMEGMEGDVPQGVTVIPEHHASGGELVDGIDLSSQGGVTRGYSTEEAAYTLFLNSSGFSLIIFLLSSRVMPTG